MRVEKEGVAEPAKQKDWTPEASQSQDCLEAVNTKPHLYPTFPGVTSIWEKLGSFGRLGLEQLLPRGKAAVGAVPDFAHSSPGGTK